MSFAPCAVVPCYNHGAAVGGVVARLRALQLPVVQNWEWAAFEPADPV